MTEKCDVYSYGVVLLELLCRKLSVDPSFEEGLDIVSWVRNLQNNNGVYCLDEKILSWDMDEQTMVQSLMDLALRCTENDAKLRPSMRDMVGSLINLHHTTETTVNECSSSNFY